MKFVLVFFAVVAVALAADKYTEKYDNIDIDAIIANDRLLKNYVKCLLDKGKCTEEGQALKEVVPEALQTECMKCNEKQKASAEKIIRVLVKSHRADWDELLAKYDPKGTHRQNYKKYYDEIKQ